MLITAILRAIIVLILSWFIQSSHAQYLFLDPSDLKIFQESDYTNYDIEQNETCLSKEEIIEKQVWFEFNSLQYAASVDTKNQDEIHSHVRRTVAELRAIAKMWSCHFNRFHLKKNSNKSMPSMEKIYQFIQNTAKEGGEKFEITGDQKFYGLFKKKYRYAINISQEGQVTFEVRVYFKFNKMPESEKNAFLERVSRIEQVWSKALPKNFGLKFARVEIEKDAHYSVKVRAHTRSALYDKFWSSYLGAEDYAHEVTHMLGLNEEYNFMHANVLDIFHGPKELEKNLQKQLIDQSLSNSFMVGVDTIRSNECFVYNLNCVAKKFFISGTAHSVEPMLHPYQLHHLLRQLPVNP